MVELKADILIAGAGMVGSAVALGAARLGYTVLLLEPHTLSVEMPARASSLGQFDLRVSALTHASVGLLRQLEVWSLVEEAAQPYRRMDVWDSRGNGRIVFDADEIYQQNLGTIIENCRVTAALHSKISEHENICVIADSLQRWQVDMGGVELTTAGGRSIYGKLFLGADGGNSLSRRLLALPTREWDYDQEALVATVMTVRPHHKVAYQQFLASGPMALLPLHDASNSERYCSLVWSLDIDKSAHYKNLPDKEFMEALGEASDYKLGAVEAVSQRLSFPLRQRHARRYIAHHSAIIGDAAHTIHPLAGQGVNLGFDDVAVILQELARARQKNLNPGDIELLRRYQRQRQPANLAMMAAMEGFKRGFGSDIKWLTWLRNQGLNRVNKTLPVKKLLMKQAMGI
jgi:2-polyprenylphenol 6-hydroxylase